MSAKMQVPGTTVRQTNVAVVRLTKNGKKLEIACYKNKVINYRSGQETRLDEVLQIERVFNNVSAGDYASQQDIKKCIGVAMDEKAAVKYILDNGELQVAAHEREHEVASMLRDISNIISQKCVNKTNMRPFPPQMIEQAIKTCGATIKLTEPAKKQALSLINKLVESQVIPIDRALMKVRVSDTVPTLHHHQNATAVAASKESASAANDKDSSTKKGKGKKGGKGKNHDSDSDSDDDAQKKKPITKAAAKKAAAKKAGDEDDDGEGAGGVPAYITNIPALKDLVAKKGKLSVEEKAKAFITIFPRCHIVADVSSPTSAVPPAELNVSSSSHSAHSTLMNIEPHLFRDVEALFASVQVIEHAVMDLSGALFVPSGTEFGGGGALPVNSTSTSSLTGTSVGHASHGTTQATPQSAAVANKSALKKAPPKDEGSDSEEEGGRRGGKGKKSSGKAKGPQKYAKKRNATESDEESGDDDAKYRRATANAKANKNQNHDDDDDGSSHTGGTGGTGGGQTKQLSAKERRKQRAERKAEQEAEALKNADSEDDDVAKKGYRKNQKHITIVDPDEANESEEYDSDDDANRREKKKKDEARKAAEEKEKERLRLEREEAERNGEIFDEEEEEKEETNQ